MRIIDVSVKGAEKYEGFWYLRTDCLQFSTLRLPEAAVSPEMSNISPGNILKYKVEDTCFFREAVLAIYRNGSAIYPIK